MSKLIYIWDKEIDFKRESALIEKKLKNNSDITTVIVDTGKLNEEKIAFLDNNSFDSINYHRKNNKQKKFYYQLPAHFSSKEIWAFLYSGLI